MKIELHPHAIKQWKRISKREHIKIAKKIKQLETAPLSGKLLHGELKGFRSFKAWPYRIIYETKSSKIIVHSIAHRQSAYS